MKKFHPYTQNVKVAVARLKNEPLEATIISIVSILLITNLILSFQVLFG